jgi:hypothetical protein
MNAPKAISYAPGRRVEPLTQNNHDNLFVRISTVKLHESSPLKLSLGGLGLEACDELAGFFVVLLFFGALGRRRTNVTFCHLKPEFAPIFVVEVEAPIFCSSLLRFACSEGRSPFELRRSPAPRPANAGGRKN